MKKRGRPFSDDPRNIHQMIRLNRADNERLEKVSKDFGMNRSDTFRKLLEDYVKKGE